MKTTCKVIALASLLFVGCGKSPDEKIADNKKRAETAQKALDEIEMFSLAVEISQLKVKSAEEFSKLDDEARETDAVAEMLKALETKRVRKEDISGAAMTYVANMRKVIAIVRTKIPDKKPWADRMEPLLAKLEAAVK